MTTNSFKAPVGYQSSSNTSDVLITVAVCTYNRANMLRQTIESLFLQQIDLEVRYEIVVIDDGSTDNTPCVLNEIAKKSPVLFRFERTEGGGVAKARNRAVAIASGVWVAFIDDDEIAAPHWLQTLWQFAVQKGTACVGGAVHLRLAPKMLERLPEACRRMLGESYGRNRPELCNERTIPGAGNLLIKKDLFSRFGGFDETLDTAGEDTLFVNLIRKAGVAVWFTPEAYIEHIIPDSRLEENYFRWSSRRVGWSFAMRDKYFYGKHGMMLRFLARTAKVFILHLSCWGLASLRNDSREKLERKCHLWRLQGYWMYVRWCFMPHNTDDKDSLDFRAERYKFSLQGENENSP
jgi:glycosyltransferase involved in cell wall biosynthesis